MTAAQRRNTKIKHTGTRKDKMRKVGSKEKKKQENHTQGVRSNKVSRLCHVESRAGDLVTLYAIFLLSSAKVISYLVVVGDDF